MEGRGRSGIRGDAYGQGKKFGWEERLTVQKKHRKHDKMKNIAILLYYCIEILTLSLSLGAFALGAGWYHTCALLTSGDVECWGYNARGELGTGETTDSLRPATVTGLLAGAFSG